MAQSFVHKEENAMKEYWEVLLCKYIYRGDDFEERYS
jgi:hypothetical protein